MPVPNKRPGHYLVHYILAAPNYQTKTHTRNHARIYADDTDSNFNVNETSDITILLADVTQAEQTPNLQWQINKNSWATSRPVCKEWQQGRPITQETAEPSKELVGRSKLREMGSGLSGNFRFGLSAWCISVYYSTTWFLDGKNCRGPKRTFEKVQGTCPLCPPKKITLVPV